MRSDALSDMLTRVRNAGQAGLRYAIVPASKLKVEVTKILESEGFVRGFRLIKDEGQGKIKIALKYTPTGEHVIKTIKRVSKPSYRVYNGVEKLQKVRGGLGIAIVSTSKGVMTDTTARAAKVGGEILAHVW